MSTTATGTENVRWDLGELYAGLTDTSFARDADDALDAATRFRRRYAGRIDALSAAELADATAEFERIKELTFRIWLFAKLSADSDTADAEAARALQRAVERQTAIESELLFFRLEWLALDDAHAAPLLEDPQLDRYCRFLRLQRRFRPYVLSEDEERVAAEKSLGGVRAWERLNTNLLAQIRVRLNGEEHKPLEALQRLRVTPDRENRRRIAEALVEALEQTIATRAAVLNAIVTDRAVEDRLRGYPTWISHRNLENEISDDAVEALVDAVTSRSDIPHRLFRLRARLLGLPQLAEYDRTAPVGGEPERFAWGEARELLVSTYSAFSPVTGELAGRMFERREARSVLGDCIHRAPHGCDRHGAGGVAPPACGRRCDERQRRRADPRRPRCKELVRTASMLRASRAVERDRPGIVSTILPSCSRASSRGYRLGQSKPDERHGERDHRTRKGA